MKLSFVNLVYTVFIHSQASVIVSGIADMSNQAYSLDVEMTCSGCSNAVNRVLEKAKCQCNVAEYTVDLATKRVHVVSSLPLTEIVKIIEKTGKKVTNASIDALKE